MSEQRSADEEKPRQKKRRYRISSWMGRPREGTWVPESVATDVKRQFEKHTHGKDSTKARPVIVKKVEEELVYSHHGYRPRFEDESKTRKAFYWRGARIWRT